MAVAVSKGVSVYTGTGVPLTPVGDGETGVAGMTLHAAKINANMHTHEVLSMVSGCPLLNDFIMDSARPSLRRRQWF